MSWVKAISNDSEGQIFCGEDAAEVFILVDHKDTVSSFGSAELGSVGDADMLWDGESWSWTKS